MPVIPYENDLPVIHPSAWIAPTAWITGKTTIGKDVSAFFGVVARGDVQRVVVGDGTNLQEHAMLHTSHDLPDCIVGSYVTVGHRAIVHGATVGSECIIGMGATILDGAVIGDNCIIGAQSLVPLGMKIPAGHLALGIPAKVIRKLTEEELRFTRFSAKDYVEVGRNYKKHFAAENP